MKVSNNALNFLLAQYRAIFKRAYVKGLASAVLLTAGLAAGQAQAANITDDDNDVLQGTTEVIVDGTETKITISGASPAATIDWSAPVKITGGAATADNYIKGTSGAVNLTGEGSLKIEVADNFTTKGLAINADAQGATVSIDSIAVNKGTLAISDADGKTASVSAQSIIIGEDPASESTPAVLAAGDPAGILSLTASGDGGSVTLGTAGETSIEVKSTGQLKVTVDSGTATINGTSLALNDKAFMLVANGNNKGNTLTVASDTFTIDQGAVHVISSESSKAVIEKFTGSTANIGGNVLISEYSTLDLSTDITGTEANDGVVTLAEGSNTVLGGTLKVSSGTLAVADDAKLNASVEGAAIAVAETSDSKSTLEISSSTLKQFLKGGAGYQDIKTDGTIDEAADDSKKGAVTIASGTLHFTDADVNLSEFAFKGDASASTANAGQITFKSGSTTNILGKNLTIEKKLDENTDGADSGIEIKATSLSLGNGKAAVDDYGFKKATVANLYNTATGEITLGNEVTLDVTLGDSAADIPVDANGVFSGNFVLDDSTNGKLTVEHGTYTHNGSLTISGGTLTVTNSTTDKDIETYLTLDQVTLYYGNSSNSGSTIDVNGSGTGVATVLDISEANLEIKAGAGSTSGSITVQSGGTLRTDSDNLLKILNKGSNSKGFAVNLKDGTLEVTEGLELDFAKLHTSAAEDKISFDASTSDKNTILVNGELALTDINGALNFDKAEFTADKLTFKMADGQTGPAVLSGTSGVFTAWSGLNGNKGVNVSGATLALGDFDYNDAGVITGVKSANGTIKTDLTVSNTGTLKVQNGSWNGASQTLKIDGGDVTVGDASFVDAAGNTFDTSLSLNKIVQNGGNTTISTVGSVTTNSLEVATGATKFQVDGSLTVNGVEAPAGQTPRTEYGVKLAAGEVTLGANASLTFGAEATKAITVNTSGEASGGWISVVDGTFGKADKTADADKKVITMGVGSTVTFNFAKGTNFTTGALTELRDEIFGQKTTLDGFVNLGSASIEGLTVENGEVAWDNLQNFIDVGDLADFTTQDLLTAKVTGITTDAELRGSLGSLSSDELDADGQIAVDGNLTLNNAAGNDGAFASNEAGDVLGLNVTQNANVTLNNGGEIGEVSFSSNGGSFVVASNNGTTTIGAIDGAHATTQFTTGTATVTGTTETKQLTTDAGTNTTFVGAVNVGQRADATDVSTLAGNTTFQGAATFNQGAVVESTGTATFARDVEFKKGASFYGNTTVDGTATFAADANGVALTVDQGAVVDINELVTQGNVFVGSVSTSAGHEGATGTLSVETLQLNGHDLVVDPDWNNEAGLAFVGVNKFTDATTSDAEAGILKGQAYALQNSILSIGNKNKDEVLAIFDKYINAQGNLSNDKDGVGAIVYVADTVEVANGGQIVADKSQNKNTYDDPTVAANYGSYGVYIGDNSVLGVEVSAANGAGAAITFAGTNDITIKATNSGKIVLTGDYDQNDTIKLFADKNGTDTVKIADGKTIRVETINGLLVKTDFNGQAFDISDMDVETERAESAFSATSGPVHESLVAYGTGNTDWRNANKQSPADKLATKTHGAVRSDIILHTDDKFYYKPEVEGEAPTKEVEDKLADRLTTINVLNPDYVEGSTDPKTSSKYSEKVAYKAYNPLLSAINNVQANSGISAESAARMADFAGVAQVALKAGNSTSDAISGRMGVGAQNSAITYANNGQGAGLWVTPIYMNSDSDGFEAQGISYGTDINLYGVALGGDYTLANGIRVGAMFNVGSGDVDGQGAGSNVSSDFDYYGFGLYAGYTMGQFSIVGDISYTAVDNDVEANTEFADIGKLETSLDSSNISFGVTGAYAFDTAAGVKVTPHVGLRYSYIDIDDYTVGSKKGAIGSYSADSLSVFSIPVGVTIASEFNAGSWSVKPSFDLTLTGNFGDDENEGTFHWNGVENIDSGLKSEIFDNFTYGATLGVAAQSASGISLGLSVGYTGSSNVDDFGVNANARFTF